MPWSSQTLVSCAWTSISSSNWFYIKQVLPRIFVSTCKIARSSLSGQRNGELYMPLRPLLNDMAWRSQRLFNGSWTSSAPFSKSRHFCAVISSRKLCAALRGLRSEALRLAQAVAREAVVALDALARMLRSMMSWFSIAHCTGAKSKVGRLVLR